MHRSVVRCRSCRVSILESFASLAGVSLPAHTITTRAPQRRFAKPQIQARREFSQYTSLRQSLYNTDSSSSEQPQSSQSPPPPPSSEGSIPWYLQIEDPAPPAPISPILALQEIPPLPSNPPAILSPILSHLSVHIGLDNLTLLDLRSLDPPPALGSNLLMIIGTARSVKHLNVSADRFCRWTRKEYKLRPFADGLLGRNELKLKLRRKARRMKLAQSVGNTTAMKEGGYDDGITTGWVCVNLGDVSNAVLSPMEEEGETMSTQARNVQQVNSESGPVEAQQLQQPSQEMLEKARRKAQETPVEGEDEYRNPNDGPETYVGFGSRTNSPRIVVQMFTEEKRAEMDLEGLWDLRNTKRLRKGEKADALAEAAVAEIGALEELDGEEGEEGEYDQEFEDDAMWEDGWKDERDQRENEAEEKRAREEGQKRL